MVTRIRFGPGEMARPEEDKRQSRHGGSCHHRVPTPVPALPIDHDSANRSTAATAEDNDET
jgi:hypothetical protein